MRIHNVTLEMSLKPFRQTDEAFVRTVCRGIFVQWLALLRAADQVSVLLWTADGSEILDYAGDLDVPLEWARFIGVASPKDPLVNDPEGKSIHSRPYGYMDQPPEHSYRSLQTIVACLRQEGRQVTGLPVRVGATFDPGPEFARSSFKYERHPEVGGAETMGKRQRPFVVCYRQLHADRRAYAGFPEGIPEGLPFGVFLGRQCRHFLTDLGFDYIWFSNGFGFGAETWRLTGPLFDRERFYPERAEDTRRKILAFWQAFRAECPHHPVETRGTNLATGIDLGSDAVPLRDIYAGGFNLTPPCNSPWAALNGDFGMELAGYMSHNCEIPEDAGGFPFRFYTHDPWWLNSPWLDRYERQPHDIYLPLSVSRIAANGVVENPCAIEFLTIDDSRGHMPDEVPNEVIPHVLTAVRHAPDEPGPLVWIYPFDEYHDLTFKEGRLDLPYFGDLFVRCAINAGVPLNTVVSSRIFARTVREHPALYRGRLLVTSVPTPASGLMPLLETFVAADGDVLLYGPVAPAAPGCLDMLNLRAEAPALSGELLVRVSAEGAGAPGRHARPALGGAFDRRLVHRPILNAGGYQAVRRRLDDPHTTVLATVSDGVRERVAALVRADPAWGGGRIAWVRGTCSLELHKTSHGIVPDDPAVFMDGSWLMHGALARLGYELEPRKRELSQPDPALTVARHGNGFFFSGFMRDTTTALALRLPQGAPLFTGHDTRLEGKTAVYHLARAWHAECRVFVEQASDAFASCREAVAGEMGIRRRLRLEGLHDATVRFFYEPDSQNAVTLLRNPVPPISRATFASCDPVTMRADGTFWLST